MELYQLKTFSVVAQTGNVTKAAQKLNTTPPSVSNHIRQLEEEFDTPLFTRTPKGMVITSQGTQLLEQAQEIIAGAEKLTLQAKQIKKNIHGAVTLGINADPSFLKIPGIIDKVYKDFPGIQLEIVTSCTGDIMAEVEKKEMTCGYAFGPVKENGVSSIFLCDVTLVIGIPKLFAQKKRAPLKEIAALPWIVPEKNCPNLWQVRSHLSNQGVDLSNKVFANDDITKTALVKKGAAVCVLEKNEAQPFIQSNVIVPWQGPDTFKNTLSFVFAADRRDDLLIQTILSIVRKVWE